MILIKQDFKDLSIVELLQNIWCYCKRTNELTERGEQIPYFYFYIKSGMKISVLLNGIEKIYQVFVLHCVK